MKKLLLYTIVIIGVLNFTVAQNVNNVAQKALTQDVVPQKAYPIPGSHFLREKEQKLIEYFEQHPEAKRLSKPLSTEDWGFTVGSTKEFWADYFEDQLDGTIQYLVPSTCRALGTHCYVFVADDVWNTAQVDQAAVNEIVSAFDSNIYPTDVATFGTPPDVDSDGRIIILILDIIDGYNQAEGGGYFAGYFYSLNEQEDGTTDGYRSNVAEIFYMDCNPADLITDRTDVLNTTAHEFQHMIHYAHGYPEMIFINEGLSEIASYICGYGFRSNGLYAQDTNVQLFEWDNGVRDVLADYSRAAFWTLYIYEQYPGTDILMDFVNNQHSEWTDIDARFRHITPTRGFFSIWMDWLIANYVNGSSNDSRYQYSYSPLSKPVPVATHFGNSGQGSGTLEPFGAEYITFSGGDDLSITFTGQTIFKVKALKIGSLEVETVTPGTEYTPTGYGTTYPEVTFLVYNESAGATQNYSYVATGGDVSGTMELAYEDGVPEGYLKFATGDSSAVFFNGISGAKLDSVKIAFRRNGRILMDISELDGSTFMRGKNLYGPVQVSSPDSTASTSPYPVPYDNWVKIDLTSKNIDVTNDFIVSFLIGNNPAEPGIMISSEPDDGVRNSRTYYKDPGTWYYISDSGTDGNIFKYLIRAYVHWGNLSVEIDQNGIVTIPNDFSLGQNYPNPFNPSTTFRFATPQDGLVKFTVHDLLGRVIYSENRSLLAGNYSFTWDGQNQLNQQVVSGVYFLRMETEGFNQTRKMLMMK